MTRYLSAHRCLPAFVDQFPKLLAAHGFDGAVQVSLSLESMVIVATAVPLAPRFSNLFLRSSGAPVSKRSSLQKIASDLLQFVQELLAGPIFHVFVPPTSPSAINGATIMQPDLSFNAVIDVVAPLFSCQPAGSLILVAFLVFAARQDVNFTVNCR
jgi:hypothetical protein